MTNCENCEKEHDGNYGSGRFCSSSCSRSFATKSKRAEINAKVSIALTRPKRLISCKHCGNTFEQQRKRVFCSISCSQSHNWQIDAYRENMQSKINAKAALGQWGGWKIRNVEPSYAEKYFIAVLDNLNIIYEREK
jgi:protein-arginine kinase activator protein McsA